MAGNNIFAVGEIASGDKFIGRRKEIERLSIVFDTTVSLHLVGAARIGKSSLVDRVFELRSGDEGCLPVRLDMSTYENASQFWYSLCEEIVDAIETSELDTSAIQKHIDTLLSMDSGDSNWYAHMRRPLTKVLEGLAKLGERIVIAIDEFDAVTRVFEGNAAYYQMLRSLFSEPKYGFNGAIVSRRNLEVLEAKTEAVSTFHGVFDTLRLKAFCSEEINEFYAKLGTCGIEIDDEGRAQFEYFTGGIPYLCCMLGKQLIDVANGENPFDINLDDVLAAHRNCQSEIWRYYNDLVIRLEEDGHLEPLVYLAFDEMRTLSYSHNRNNMLAMGYLNEELGEDGSYSYYAYSRGFMAFLRSRPLSVPIWDLLSASEKKLKEIFAAEFPLFANIHSQDARGTISQSDKNSIANSYPELNFGKWTQQETFLRDSNAYMDNPSVLDVLAITYVIDEINYFWDARFSKYFNDDVSWKNKLAAIKSVRNPFAHAHGDCISEKDRAQACLHMQELLNLEV